MAKYTVELRTLMNDTMVRPKLDLALSTYPMYTPKTTNEDALAIIPTREILNQKLLNHYKYREIGFDTIGRFLDELEITMNEIMPRYNQMYGTVETMANLPSPFDNVDVIEEYSENRTSTGTSTGNSTTNSSAEDSSTTTATVNSNHKNLETENPQGNISKTPSQIDDVTHADKANWTKDNSTNNGSSTGNSSTNATSSDETNTTNSEEISHTYTKRGNQGVNTYAHDMNEFRTSIIDVTMQIIEDRRIKELFMMVY